MRAWLESPVREAAQVFVNGKAAGAVWKAPFEVEITGLLKPGDNAIRVVVANLALNVLAKDPLPDYKELIAKYGDKFQPQDMVSVRSLPGGHDGTGDTGGEVAYMDNLGFAPIGLLLAAAMSVTNVMTDVWRKRALDQRDLFPATFWMRVAVAAIFAIVLLVQILRGEPIVIRDAGLLFGAFQLAPVPTFLIYLVLDVGLITIVMWLYFRALQISPLSMCVPFLAFTPVFLIPSTYIILGQKPEPIKLLGVALIVAGSLAMHRQLFAVGWLAPVKAVLENKGSRYMLIVALIFSLTNPLDAKLVKMSDVFTESFAYGVGLCISFYLLAKSQKGDFAAAARGNVKWIVLAGLFDAVSPALSTRQLRVHPRGDHGEHQARGNRAERARGLALLPRARDHG